MTAASITLRGVSPKFCFTGADGSRWRVRELTELWLDLPLRRAENPGTEAYSPSERNTR